MGSIQTMAATVTPVLFGMGDRGVPRIPFSNDMVVFFVSRLYVCACVCVLVLLFLCFAQPGGKVAYDDLLAFFKASRLVIDFDEIELKSVIGSGAFATVFRGVYHVKGGRGQDEEKVRWFRPGG